MANTPVCVRRIEHATFGRRWSRAWSSDQAVFDAHCYRLIEVVVEAMMLFDDTKSFEGEKRRSW